jgi:predicted nucleic acid-binding protein
LTKESKNFSLLLDTEPIIKLFSKKEGWETVQKILRTIEKGDLDAAISIITLTEVYSKYLHEGRIDLAKSRVQELRYAVYLKKIEVDDKIAVKAGELKGKYSLPLADSIIAATAFYSGRIIISCDSDFRKVTEVRVENEEKCLRR